MEELDYGNQDSVEYTYDAQGRVTQETYEDGATVTYSYDNTGALATVTDSETGITTTYYYDLIDRLVKYEEKGANFTHSVTYIYDEKNNLSSLTEVINGVKTVYTYAYDDDNRVTSVSVGNGTTTISTVSYTYDAFGRITDQVTKHGDSTVLTESTTFKTVSDTELSGQIIGFNGFGYTYDNNGNIASVTYGSNTTTYEYDSANQLIRENNQALGKTWRWTYDAAGNIQSREEYDYTLLDDLSDLNHTTIQYGYDEEGAWGDLLLSYGSMEIEYDAIGNPTKFGNWEMAWQHGRQLASITDGTTTWNYTYNSNGMRTERTDGVNNYTYVYNGSQLTAMTKGTDTLQFSYDLSGTPVTLTYNGTVYYYSTNAQGDVIAILNNAGEIVVTYVYDAWGKIYALTDNSGCNIGMLNPLRFRAYIYDQETGWYYLQSRYYDPAIGRFLNADVDVATGQGLTGNNMFAYCGNNPVNRSDFTGEDWWHWALAAAVVVVAAAAVVVTAGGAAAAVVAVTSVANGVAAATTASTVAAGVFIGSSTALAVSAVNASVNSKSLDEFADHGESALYSTIGGGIWGGLSGFELNAQQKATKSRCFVAGTLVQSERGAIPIETISVGDYVWAWDEQTGTVALKEVVETYINETDELIHIFVCGEEIIATPSHPFYSPVKGWTDAVHLRAGDILVLVNGEYVVVEKVQHEILETPVTVYNFQVEDYHTYYVAESGVLVHNSCSTEKELPQDGTTMDSSDALDVAIDFLDTNYSEASPGRFVSQDGLRQVRLTDSDLRVINNHAGAPHINFEILAPNPLNPGKFMIIGKSHVFIID